MPHTRLERTLAGLGATAILVLIALVVREWGVYQSRLDANRQAAVPELAAGAAQTSTPTPTSTLPTPTPTPTPTLRMTAARGDCWVELHRGSSSGTVLYEGVLAKGKTLKFPARRLWIRFGAGENVDLRLGDELLRDVPQGAADAVVTPRGISAATS